MTAGDSLKAEETGATSDESVVETTLRPDANGPDALASSDKTSAAVKEDAEATEADNDEAWIDACRDESDDADEPETSKTEDPLDRAIAPSDDLKTPHRRADDSENEDALTDDSDRPAAIEKTGDDAMSKFGHAIGALAESTDDLDDRDSEYAEMDKTSDSRDSGVAPYIANAERELEQSKSSGPVDIFDRIAQAAESQFDESRGNTAKRVSELVDDRRVGTKRWTPSKTMRQRMEKLEAARAAANGSPVDTASEAPATPSAAPEAPIAAAAAVAASAPSSSTATMVTPNAPKKPTEKPVEAAAEPDQPQERVIISRRDKQVDSDETAEETIGAEPHVADDADELRVVPGARGRRRDRARKSRLDEDFEKIFDEEGKPSIGSLRRKLRSGSASNDEDGPAADPVRADAAVTEEEFGATAAAPKVGLFSRLLKSKGKKAAAVEAVEAADTTIGEDPSVALDTSRLDDEDSMVEAFEADNKSLTDKLDFESDDDEDWEKVIDTERKQKQVAMIIIGAAIAIAVGAAGYFFWRMF